MHFKKLHRKIIFILLIAVFCTEKTSAQTPTLNTKKELKANKLNETIAIDGKFNEAIWEKTETANNFVMFSPDNGKPEPETAKTEVKIVYDNTAIYVAAKLYDSEPNKILAEINERDELGISDVFGVFINGYNDGQQDFRFLVSAANGQADCLYTEQTGEDFSWNSIYDSKAIITDYGWAVEMKIPYAALRFPNKKEQIWGINFIRDFRRERQVYAWNPIDATIGNVAQQHGVLNGIIDIKTPTRLFFIPYASAYYESTSQGTETTLKGGMDIKYGINDAFTLDAILIPDFGQTKFDNVVLNLGPFEQQFNENRAFFTEGTDLFSKGNVFYSRRIGGPPVTKPTLSDNEEISAYPAAVNLVNALKVSGRTKDGLGIGFLNAITKKTEATIKNNTNEETRNEVVEPLTNYNVIVFDQRFNKNSSVSFLNTNVTRNGHFRDANVSVLAFDLNNKNNSYNFGGNLKYSTLNLEEKNKNGYVGQVGFGKTSGNIRFRTDFEYTSKDWDNNDLGINFQTNYYSFYNNINYRILNPKGIFNTFRVNLNQFIQFHNQTQKIQSSNLNFNINSTTKKNDFYGGGFNHSLFETYDYYEPRAEDRFLITPKFYGGWFYFSSNYNNKFAIDINPEYYKFDQAGRYNWSLEIEPRYRFSNKLSVVYGIEYGQQYNDIGYVDSTNDNIIMAMRNRNTTTNSLSGKYAINSQMNFNITVRHYWSYAKNNGYYNLTQDGLLDLNSSYTENKNSNFNTWNTDLTFSWWFAPGSQLTALYRNNAAIFSNDINTNFNSNLNAVFRDDLNQIFSVSVRYFLDYNQIKNVF